jgi:hypothetical protein
MRRLATLILTAAVGLGLASTAGAALAKWSGTLTVNMPLAGLLPPFEHEHLGTGLATVNGTAGGHPYYHINTITIASVLSFTGGNNVPEGIPLTDPENPTLISLWGTGMRVGKVTTGGVQPAIWNGISGGPPLGSQSPGRLPGNMKMCLFFPGCMHHLPIPLGTQGGNAVGVGGMWTVNTFSKGPGFKLSLQGAPWTIGVASITNVTTETPNGGISTYTKTLQGFVDGGVCTYVTSFYDSCSGVIQLVTPVFIQTNLGAPDALQAGWVEVRLQFPEPGLLLLLVAGGAGLVVLGRNRMRG